MCNGEGFADVPVSGLQKISQFLHNNTCYSQPTPVSVHNGWARVFRIRKTGSVLLIIINGYAGEGSCQERLTEQEGGL